MLDFIRRVVVVIAAACLLAGQAVAETISFPSSDVSLTGELFRPAGAGPFPAVVALHGCAGLRDRSGALSPRHQDWADRLVARGFLVLLPDSFGSRGLKSQCRTRERTVRPWRERVMDAIAAKAYLQSRRDVRPDAVSLLGWSNGGSTVLYVIGRVRSRGDSGADFARAVAFYPGCRAPGERPDWHARVPLLILIGAADDWTPAAPCAALASRTATPGAPVTLHTYPGAYHDFDHPSLPVRVRKGLAYTGSGGGAAHVGTDPAARADAIERVPAFLEGREQPR